MQRIGLLITEPQVAQPLICLHAYFVRATCFYYSVRNCSIFFLVNRASCTLSLFCVACSFLHLIFYRNPQSSGLCTTKVEVFVHKFSDTIGKHPKDLIYWHPIVLSGKFWVITKDLVLRPHLQVFMSEFMRKYFVKDYPSNSCIILIKWY